MNPIQKSICHQKIYLKIFWGWGFSSRPTREDSLEVVGLCFVNWVVEPNDSDLLECFALCQPKVETSIYLLQQKPLIWGGCWVLGVCGPHPGRCQIKKLFGWVRVSLSLRVHFSLTLQFPHYFPLVLVCWLIMKTLSPFLVSFVHWSFHRAIKVSICEHALWWTVKLSCQNLWKFFFPSVSV